MKSRHITEILDRSAFAELSESDLAIIKSHASDCPQCLREFEAARVSSVLLKFGSEAQAPPPSPFFQVKVINALREKQNLRKPIAAFQRWWQASAAPIFLMLMTVAVLISLTFLAPQSSADDSLAEVSSYNLYSTDAVILNQNPARELTTEQVFQELYNTRSESKK